MKEILEVLDKSVEPLTLTDIIMKIKNLEPYYYREEGIVYLGNKPHLVKKREKIDHPVFESMKLASSLADRYVSYWDNDTESDKLFATYTRAVKNLWKYELVKRRGYVMGKGLNVIKHRFKYEITDKGREHLNK